MYDITFLATMNQVDFDLLGGWRDAVTNEDLDLSIYTWKFEVLDPGSGCARLTASTENGKFTIPQLGYFQIKFTAAEMKTLCPQTYPTRMIVALGDESRPCSVGPLPVIDR